MFGRCQVGGFGLGDRVKLIDKDSREEYGSVCSIKLWAKGWGNRPSIEVDIDDSGIRTLYYKRDRTWETSGLGTVKVERG